MPDPSRTLNTTTLFYAAKRAGRDAHALQSVLRGHRLLFNDVRDFVPPYLCPRLTRFLQDTPWHVPTHKQQDEQEVRRVLSLPQTNHGGRLGSGLFSLMPIIDAHFARVGTSQRMRFLSIG